MCGKSLSSRSSIQALGLLLTPLCWQVWSCPSHCHSQAAHAMSLPSCPLHVIWFLWLIFSANKAPHLHPYGLRAPIPSQHCTASSVKHPGWGSFPGIPVWDFLERVLGLIQNPTQQSNGLSPTPSYQRTSTPAQCHCHLIKQTQRCQESAVLAQNSNLSPLQSEPVTFPIISTDLQGVNLGYGL